MVSIKIATLAKFELLEKIQAKQPLSEADQETYLNLLKCLSFVGQTAEDRNKIILAGYTVPVGKTYKMNVNEMMC